MTGSISEQSQRAILAMREAGFARSEFHVRTQREPEAGHYINRAGRRARSFHYGDAIIFTDCPNERVVELTDALVAAGLTVHEWTASGFRTVHVTRPGYKPSFMSYAEHRAEWDESEAIVADWNEKHPDDPIEV